MSTGSRVQSVPIWWCFRDHGTSGHQAYLASTGLQGGAGGLEQPLFLPRDSASCFAAKCEQAASCSHCHTTLR